MTRHSISWFFWLHSRSRSWLSQWKSKISAFESTKWENKAIILRRHIHVVQLTVRREREGKRENKIWAKKKQQPTTEYKSIHESIVATLQAHWHQARTSFGLCFVCVILDPIENVCVVYITFWSWNVVKSCKWTCDGVLALYTAMDCCIFYIEYMSHK